MSLTCAVDSSFTPRMTIPIFDICDIDFTQLTYVIEHYHLGINDQSYNT